MADPGLDRVSGRIPSGFLRRYASFAMALGLIKPMFVSPCYKQIEGVLPISRSHVMSDNLVIQAQLLTGFDAVIQCDN